jgi:GT2 family glycosyltransferase
VTEAGGAPAAPVCVVVVRWNAAEETARCLSSLRAVRYPNLTICLVDNASTDGAAPRLAEAFPQIETLVLPENRGYAGGCNAGIDWARQMGMQYVLLLNNDTVVDSELIWALVDRAEALRGPAILAPKILYLDRPDRIWSAGSHLDRRSPPGLHIGMDEDACSRDADVEVDWASGCALFFPMSVVDRIGPMEERYFLYLEDVDWCLTARRHAIPIWYVPSARLWHAVSAATGTLVSGSTHYYAARNTYLLVFRHFRAVERVRLAARLSWTLLKATIRTAFSPSYRHDPVCQARAVALLDAARGRGGRCRLFDGNVSVARPSTSRKGSAA